MEFARGLQSGLVSFRDNIVPNVKFVAKTLITDVLPSLILSSERSKTYTTVQTLCAFSNVGKYSVKCLRGSESRRLNLLMAAGWTVFFAKQMGCLIDRHTSIQNYVMVECCLIAFSVFTTLEQMRKDSAYLWTECESQLSRPIRQSLVSSNGSGNATNVKVCSLVLGMMILCSDVQYMGRLLAGASFASNLDSQEVAGVLKHRAIHHFTMPKYCTAVIIDGTDNDSSGAAPGVNAQLTKLYEHCDTRYFNHIDSAEKLEMALKNAVVSFGKPIDILASFGHGSPNGQYFYERSNSRDRDYYFVADKQEIQILQENLNPEQSQFLLLGCNTATRVHSQVDRSLASSIAKQLPKTRVTGVASYYSPELSTMACFEGVCDLSSLYLTEEYSRSDTPRHFSHLLTRIWFNAAKTFG